MIISQHKYSFCRLCVQGYKKRPPHLNKIADVLAKTGGHFCRFQVREVWRETKRLTKLSIG
jgi:hypothetical protein